MIAQLSRYGNGPLDKDISGNLWANHPMMAVWGGNAVWVYSLLSLVTWVLVIAVLVALLRWLWKKGDKTK